MNFYLYRLIDGASLSQVKHELEKKGLKDTFIIEEEATFIGGHAKKAIVTSNALLVEEKPASVDWTQQWSLFAENFHDGLAHIQLGEKTLLLRPGPGFGDLSHPTTALMIDLMKPHMPNASIIDIGTGSGILSLAALLLGARSAIGIDIDLAALRHAKENAKINHLKATFSKSLPKKLPKENLLLMNMIFPEQIAFDPARLNHLAKYWIVSGILKSQKKAYLAQAKKWGWKLIAEEERFDWLGFVFAPRSSRS